MEWPAEKGPTVTPKQKIELRQSERRERLNELAGLDTLTEDQTTELDTLTGEYQTGERQLRAAIIAEDAETAAATAVADTGADPERTELRSRCKIGNFLRARIEHRSLTGAEAELAAEIGLDGGGIPMELWDEPADGEPEKRAVAGVPATVGTNLDLIRPAVFAPSILPKLGVEMPRVPSGTYASATITGSLTAGARTKGNAQAGTAATFGVTTATPKSISARLELAIEDIAAIGQDNYESALRENLSMVLSDTLDTQGLNGSGTAPNLQGLVGRLTDPDDPTDVADWDAFAGLAADHVDGLWASMESDVALLVNVDAYKLAAKTFRQPGSVGTPADQYSDTPGEMSAGAYIESRAAAWWTNSRMPATSSDIAIGIAHRRGRSGMRTAVCPVWGEIMIDDVYSGSASGERYVTVHVLCGDVIVVQSGAYSRFDLKVS